MQDPAFKTRHPRLQQRIVQAMGPDGVLRLEALLDVLDADFAALDAAELVDSHMVRRLEHEEARRAGDSELREAKEAAERAYRAKAELLDATPPTRHAEPERESAPTSDERALRILAAEDNATNQLVLKAILGQKSLEAVFVENGLEAVEAVRGGEFDVVLMDLHMPVMDGVTATQAIRRLDGAKGRTPIVAVTAEAMPEQVRRCLAAGVDAHVAKPVRPAVLYAAIEDVLTRGAEVRLSA